MTTKRFTVKQQDVLLWMCALVLCVYMVSAFALKLWYIAAAVALFVSCLVVTLGAMRVDGLLSQIAPLAAYFGYLLMTSLWAMDSRQTVTFVAIDSVQLVVFVLFYVAVLNNPPERVRDMFISLAYPGLAATVLQYAANPESIRTGGYALNVLPLALVFCILVLASKQWRKAILPFLISLAIIFASRSRSHLLAALVEMPLALLFIRPRFADILRLVARLSLLVVVTMAVLLACETTRLMVVKTYVRITGEEQEVDGTVVKAERADLVRAAITADGIQLLRDHWKLGIGYMNFYTWFESRYGFPMNTHNSLIAWPLEGGVPCVAIVAFLLLRFFLTLRHRTRVSDSKEERDFCRACLVVMLGVLLIGLFHRAHQAPTFFLLLGIGCAMSQRPRTPLRVRCQP